MFLIDKISRSLASKISSTLSLDKDQEKIIAYGAFNLIQIFYCVVLVIIFGFAFGVLIESLVILFSESILRKYSGGVHSGSPNRCAAIGTIFSVGLGLLAKYMSIHINFEFIIGFGVLTFIFAFTTVYKLAPVDNPSKPIKKEKTRLRLKKASINVLYFLFFVSTILLILYYIHGALTLKVYTLCVFLGVIWQAFSLTKLGHAVLKRIDTFLDISSYKGGEINER